VSTFDYEPLALGEVQLVHAAYETLRADAVQHFPPALRHTNPSLISWLVFQGAETPFGRVAVAQTRVSCMVGILKRLFVLSTVTDNPDMAAWLAAHWGAETSLADVAIVHRADSITAEVSVAGSSNLNVSINDPTYLPPVDVPLLSTLHRVQTPEGPRLLDLAIQKSPIDVGERGTPVVHHVEWPAGSEFRFTLPTTGIYQRVELTLSRPDALVDPEVPMGLGRSVLTFGS
jgi:hypothetical protein